MTTFNQLLARPPQSFFKHAGVESADEQQMERDFANMAFSFLTDRATGLLPFLLGFEVVEREEDGSAAVGIFGFKLGDDYYYAPSFFVNGQVRGMDMLFGKKTNSFIPMRESWINYIVNRQAISLGGTAGGSQNLRADMEQPNFDFVARPPQSKQASVDEIVGWGFEAWNLMQKSAIDSLNNDPAFQEAYACTLARMTGKPLPIEKTATGSAIVEFLAKHGGPAAQNVLLTKLASEPALINATLTFYPSITSLMPDEFAAELAPREKQAAKLTVKTAPTSDSSPSERSKILSEGFSIDDKREPSEKSDVVGTDYLQTFANPDSPGNYKVLLRSGAAVDAWVLESPKGFVVVHPKDKYYFHAQPNAMLVIGGNDTEAKPAFDSAKSLGSMRPNGKYVLINEAGKCSVPFRLQSVIAANGRRTQLKIDWCEYAIPASGRRTRSTYTSSPCCEPCSTRGEPCSTSGGGTRLELADHTGNLTNSGDVTIVPSNWKALQIFESYDYEEERPDGDYYSAAVRSWRDKRDAWNAVADEFRPAEDMDLEMLLEKTGMHSLVIHKEPGDSVYHLKLDERAAGSLSYKTASIHLAAAYRIDATEAQGMLKQADADGKITCYVKFAQGIGVSMPDMPPPSTGFDEFSGVPIEYAQQQELQGQTYGMPPVDNSMAGMMGTPGGQSAMEAGMGGQMGPEASVDQKAMMLAQQAGQAGQKHVFDHAAIGGLSKLYDSAAVIDSYLPELSKALDRVGRILFIFNWKNDEFGERYGTDDMGGMEDMLRGVFKSFGDLVLKLKQKSVDVDNGVDQLTA